VSVRERRNRKDRRAKTWDQLKAWRCRICQAKITHAEIASGAVKRLPLAGAPKAHGWVHVTCPPWAGLS
jgi:hypothetical protein